MCHLVFFPVSCSHLSNAANPRDLPCPLVTKCPPHPKVVSLGRELLGGNGIVTDFLVAKAFCDLEAIYTYEGTYDINMLVAGRENTGISAFKTLAPSVKFAV